MPQVFHHEALLRARLDLNLTQEQLAAAVGVDVRTYRRYESGAVNDPRQGFSVRHPTRRRMLERLCVELGLTEEELLLDTNALAHDQRPTPTPPRSTSLPPSAPSPAPESPPASPPTTLVPLHVHALQRAKHFVGRAPLLAMLSPWIAAPRPAPRVLTLLGVGGAGKTAVLDRALAELGDAPQRGGVFVWSFYEDERIESFLAEALRYFARGAESGPGERLLRLEEALRDGAPHLLALDGLEVVQAEGGGGRAHGELVDPLLRRLLCALARGLGAARALVTSRFSLTDLDPWAGDGAGSLPLSSLSSGEASDLLRAWGVRGDDDTLRGLSAPSGGHALSVAVLGSYVGSLLGGDPAAFRSAALVDAARDDALARRLASILSAYADALPPSERDLLARLSLLPAAAEEEALLTMVRAGGMLAGTLAGWGIAELRRGLARLERLGLVFVARAERPLYSTHPFVRDHFRALAAGLRPAAAAALASSSEGSLLRAPRHAPRDTATLELHEALIGQLLEQGRAVDAWDVYRRGLGGFSHLGLVLGEMSRGARVLRAFSAATDLDRQADGVQDDDPHRLPEALPPLSRAELAYERGLYAAALGELGFARRCYEAHNRLVEDLQEPIHLTTGLRTLAYTERLAGSLRSALALVDRAIAIAERDTHPAHITRGLSLRAAILHDLGDDGAAADAFAAARSLGDRLTARRGLWEAERELALGHVGDASRTARRILGQCEHLGWQGHASHAHALLGHALLEERDLLAATESLTRARHWVTVSGEVEAALRCHELAARIGLAREAIRREGGVEALDATNSATHEAAVEADTGLQLATLSGFGPARTRLAILAARAAFFAGSSEALVLARAALAGADLDDARGHAEAQRWVEIVSAPAQPLHTPVPPRPTSG
ncbi:helix-turn-helix domain-containing protein [Chondromyces crocatus]|uniref:HTH cro/C1-type domain-containing protein n=1 Tax=Chondromyces crocatus TaxID=52 RepID=A0A0K1EIM2_CHOCO|nr:uncharacterized protein CMC5_048670 [Chondromyces crocatus]